MATMAFSPPRGTKRNGPFGYRLYTIIYAIDAPDIGRVKFGRTLTVHRRFRALSSQSPCPLILLGYSWLPEEFELAIFKFLAEDRCHGEWFVRTQKVRDVAALISAGMDVELARAIGADGMISEDIPSNVSWAYEETED